MLVDIGGVPFLRFTVKDEGVRFEPVSAIRGISVQRVFKDPSVIPTDAQKANPDNWISGSVVVSCTPLMNMSSPTPTGTGNRDYIITESLEELEAALGVSKPAPAAKKAS